MKRKILFVCRPESIHNARWLSQLWGESYELHVFPSFPWAKPHLRLPPVFLHRPMFPRRTESDKKYLWSDFFRRMLYRLVPCFHRFFLAATIRRLQPDLIHAIEIQNGGYLVGAVRSKFNVFPPLIVTCWGSDIYYYRRFPEHVRQIERVLKTTSVFHAECKRDQQLALQHGFTGVFTPLIQASGMLNLKEIATQRGNLTPSNLRTTILLKGNQGEIGRGVVGLKAILATHLPGKKTKVIIISPSDATLNVVRQTSVPDGLSFSILPPDTDHQAILAAFGEARIYLGLSISDGVPNTLLEAMAMGAFPIQSFTSAANEWIRHECTGFLVSPEDQPEIERYLIKGIEDHLLIASGTNKNWETILSRIHPEKVLEQVKQMYRDALGSMT